MPTQKVGVTQIGQPSVPLWPDSVPMRQWCAKVMRSEGKGAGKVLWCMIQVAIATQDRKANVVGSCINDAMSVGSYASMFNQHITRSAMQRPDQTGIASPDNMPGVSVCSPVAAVVAKSAVPDLVAEGEHLMIVPYPSMEVQKFVFDGSEDFLELPQAFFHYVAWKSGGNELVGDIQGVQDDQDVLIVDPVVLRSTQPGIGDL